MIFLIIEFWFAFLSIGNCEASFSLLFIVSVSYVFGNVYLVLLFIYFDWFIYFSGIELQSS